MQHYWGAKAILARAGFSPLSYRKFPEYLVRHQIPAFPRRHSHRKPMYYSSEAMMIAWELNKARQFYENVSAEQAANKDRRYRCRDRERQSVAA